MKRIMAALPVLAVLAIFPIAGCGAQAAAEDPTVVQQAAIDRGDTVVTDMLGREVSIPGEAATFACIGPGCLRLYCYVGDTAALVGVEDSEADITGRPYMIANSELASVTVIGPGGPNNAPDPERLLVEAPDVIFTTYNSDVAAVDELQNKTGIPVVALSYGTVAVFDPAVDSSLALIGLVTGNEARATEVAGYVASLKGDLTERVSGIADEDRPTVYLGAQSMRGIHGIESTSGNYEIFNVLDAVNVVDEVGIHEYVMLDKEALLDMDPDVIIIDAGGYALVVDDYTTNPSFYNSLRAVKNDRVYLQMPYNCYSTNIEVAIADAYYVGSVLYPEQFADVDIAEKFDEICTMMLGDSVYEEFAAQYYGGYQQVSLGS